MLWSEVTEQIIVYVDRTLSAAPVSVTVCNYVWAWKAWWEGIASEDHEGTHGLFSFPFNWESLEDHSPSNENSLTICKFLYRESGLAKLPLVQQKGRPAAGGAGNWTNEWWKGSGLSVRAHPDDTGFWFTARFVIGMGCFSKRAAAGQKGINSGKFVLCSRSV